MEKIANVIILRVKIKEEKLENWEIVSQEKAFKAMLDSDRWGGDDYVEESETEWEFKQKCNAGYSERITESHRYIFINTSVMDNFSKPTLRSVVINEDPNDFS